MKTPIPKESEKIERRKRKREIILAIGIGLLFILLVSVEVQLVTLSKDLPFAHSIFFFGLVNFNIVLLLFLLFLIFRNVVKIFVERRGKIIGSSLKSKLIAAFVLFSFVPTILMLFISFFYINSSFDKWFSIKVSSVLRDSLDVTNEYFLSAKQENYGFAHEIKSQIEYKPLYIIRDSISELQKKYRVDIVEFYPNLFDERTISQTQDKVLPQTPRASIEFLKKGIVSKSESSVIHHYSEGNLIRVIVPVKYWSKKLSKNKDGALVVSTLIPISLISKMNDIAQAYTDFKDFNPIANPVKTIYLIILFLMALVILAGATWFGFYLARQLATPLSSLGKAAERIAKGNYTPVQIKSGSQEINQLVGNFNEMVRSLDQSEKELVRANVNMKAAMEILDEHGRYVEVVLSNVSAGVISVDPGNVITTINRRAAKLLGINPETFIGKDIRKVIPNEELKLFADLIEQIKKHGIQSLQKELRLNLKGKALLMRTTLTILRDEKGQELGIVVVFDDLTELVNAQRAAAWREVAKRIAHEIKNPLTPIKLSAQRLEKKFGQTLNDPAFEACTSTIIKQVDDLKNLVNEFSQFARLPQASPQEGALNEIIREALVLYETGHRNMSFNFKPDEDLPRFEFDPEQIKRVVTNLLENAVQAVGTVSVPEVELSTHYDNILNIVKIRVTDNGVGIPENERDRIFEPYYSTKSGGTGLGLAIVKRIIEDHSGFIRAFSKETGGTQIVIELPVTMARKHSKRQSELRKSE